MAPIKLKLSLSSASTSSNIPSTPSVKLKLPSTSSNNVNATPSHPPPRDATFSDWDMDDSVIAAAPSTPGPSGGVSGTPGTVRSKGKPAKGIQSASKAKSAKGKVTKATPKSQPRARPSAIPSRLLSSGPSTPKPSTNSLPASYDNTPSSVSTDVKVELYDEDDEDPLARPISPSAVETSDVPEAAGGMMQEETGGSTPGVRGRPAIKWQRTKKPLKELVVKILAELRRKDEYLLFEDPVNVDEFPNYLQIIGGEENMMDISTMQRKNEDGEYRNMDEVQADVWKIVSAAQTFNAPGTVPFSSAGRLLAHGLKHIDRARPIVRTPTPSPTRPTNSDAGTPFRGQSVVSGREGTVPPTAALSDLPPTSYIPVEMLEFPPNSLEGLAVGWHMTGGKRIWSKRIIRGREKFTGKWRNWMLDGTRDLAEMEDLPDWFADKKSSEDETLLRKVDWKGMRKEPPWWEVELGGPLGQPPVPFTGYPKPHPLRHRTLGVSDWGIYPEVDAESRILAAQSKQPEHLAMSDHLRPTKPRHPPPIPNESYFVNYFDGHLDVHPSDTLGQMIFGDITGEAYHRSMREFVGGAIKSAETDGADVKEEKSQIKEEESPLEEYVRTQWRGGIFSHPHRTVAKKTLAEIDGLRQNLVGAQQPIEQRQQKLLEVAKGEYARRALQYLARNENQLDLTPLLYVPSDFMHPGMGGKASTKEGIEWVGKQLSGGLVVPAKPNSVENSTKRQNPDDTTEPDAKRIKVSSEEQTASKQIDKATQMAEETEEMRRLRLELVALCKFYPLAALAKMNKEDADKLLPANVRPLMTKK